MEEIRPLNGSKAAVSYCCEEEPPWWVQEDREGGQYPMISPQDCTCFQAWLEAGVWWDLPPAWSLDCGTVCERARGGGSGGLSMREKPTFWAT